MIKKIFNWIFKSEIEKLNLEVETIKDSAEKINLEHKLEIERLSLDYKLKVGEFESEKKEAKQLITKLQEQHKTFEFLLSNIDVSVDVHEHNYSPSWAVISLQGQKTDYIKFINLGQSDIKEIASFLRNFERDSNLKIDAYPPTSRFLKISK